MKMPNIKIRIVYNIELPNIYIKYNSLILKFET